MAQGRLDSSLSVSIPGYKKEGDRLFSKVCGNRTRGNGFKLGEGKFRLDVRQFFFFLTIITVRIMKHCNRLPRSVVEALSLETFKDRLDQALSNLIQL